MSALLLQAIERLQARVNQLERRMNNMLREGEITDVDYESGTAVMNAGGIKTAMSPWLTRAGAVRDWNPVTAGERAIFISPTGEPGLGLILPGGFSSAFPQNHDRGAEPTRTVGDTFIQQTPQRITLMAAGAGFTLDASGVSWTVPAGGHRVNS